MQHHAIQVFVSTNSAFCNTWQVDFWDEVEFSSWNSGSLLKLITGNRLWMYCVLIHAEPPFAVLTNKMITSCDLILKSSFKHFDAIMQLLNKRDGYYDPIDGRNHHLGCTKPNVNNGTNYLPLNWWSQDFWTGYTSMSQLKSQKFANFSSWANVEFQLESWPLNPNMKQDKTRM